jgi:hypothetical protein
MRTVISVIELQSDLEREWARCGRAPIAGVPADRDEGNNLVLPELGLACTTGVARLKSASQMTQVT